MTGQGKANELFEISCVQNKEGEIIVASGSKSKLWRDISLKANNTKTGA